jgi:hypothetical protein
MDWHFCWGDNAEFHPLAVHGQNRNRNIVANGDYFSELATENQHVSSLRGNTLLRTVVSDEQYSTPCQVFQAQDAAEHPIRTFLIACRRYALDRGDG